jgi:mono/diheme cytochrome c family protein
MRAVLVATLVTATLGIGARAQRPVTPEPMLQKTTVGSELYRFYCANCHGLDAKGRPAASGLRAAAPNLTTLSINSGGVFPREVVRDVIVNGSGRGAVHGTADMPVWGTIFRAFEPNDTMVEVRIDNLVRYLESVQVSAVGTNSR